MHKVSSNLVPHVNNEKDILYFTNLQGWILSSVGIWPIKPGIENNKLQIFLTFIVNLVFCFTFIPCIFYIMFDETNESKRYKILGLWSFGFVVHLKYVALLHKRSLIHFCLEHLKEDWRKISGWNDRESMFKHAKIGRNLTLISVFFLYGGGVLYNAALQLLRSVVNNVNFEARVVIYPSYSRFFDASISPVYELTYTTHCICQLMTYSVACGICGLAALFASHACGQVEVLTSKLIKLADANDDDDSVNEQFCTIIQLHLRILRFCAVLEEIMQEVCLIELIGSAFLICLLEYFIVSDWEESNTVGIVIFMMFLISLSLNLFILCYIGDLLTEQTGKVGTICFMMNWYRLPVPIVRGLILMIAMSNSPAKLSAGKISNMTVFTFMGVMKTSVAYLNFIRQVFL
ncbi:odorant receptor 13a-like [Prorops nasuta]|uniref:odorant receptor 13a-like n=1 Tax=Prorops nasuta TaxID=863751 RepID=UPI0034CF2D3E